MTYLPGLHLRMHALPALSPDPALSVLRRDLHPDNVMLGPRGPMVIDRRNEPISVLEPAIERRRVDAGVTALERERFDEVVALITRIARTG
jgi:hypothetical protein